eukprot:jgi/Orpsp1_1/1180497/evm.model.c7180000073651.1
MSDNRFYVTDFNRVIRYDGEITEIELHDNYSCRDYYKYYNYTSIIINAIENGNNGIIFCDNVNKILYSAYNEKYILLKNVGPSFPYIYKTENNYVG